MADRFLAVGPVPGRLDPDPGQPPTVRIEGGTELVEVGRHAGWVRVATPDAQAVWVDARRLAPLVDAPSQPRSPRPPTPAPAPAPHPGGPAPTAPAGGPSPRPRSRRRALAPLLVVALVTVGGTIGLFTLADGGAETYWREPSWSPDGQRIVVVGDQGDLYTVRSDGTDLTRVTDGRSLGHPAWSPDGSRFAVDGPGGFSLMSTDGSGEVPVVDDGSEPAWSPDGNRLAFASEGDIWLVDPDGSDVVRLTDTVDLSEHHPAWSPDGDRVAFAARPTEDVLDWTIWVMNADGSDRSQLGPGGNPAWSADGRHIAYECGFFICVMDADGLDPVRITRETDNRSHENPIWSPDGSRITFNDSEAGDFDLYVVSADGSDQVRLLG